ncbi:ATP-binding protein [Pseudanabaena mucicola]|uniref:histidine kinase n=1 Tax=Pseudanabaena mucicola FACHB-723 TaxID=2692860 RepID=A0ABR7ZZW5_9CYAN|nr:ATP-binding protein [Pseudanabaena mucicola]MBD2188836.1 response regulator [Pseudanabaena mucicola FACHB-723]
MTNFLPRDILSAVSRNPLIVSPELNVIEAIALMDKTGSSYVIVCREDVGQVIGILTERDIIRLNSQRLPLDQLVVQAVMSHPVITIQVSELTDINAVIMLFQEHSVRHLPVLDGDRLVGLLEKENLTELLTKQVQAFAQNPIAQTQNRSETGDRQTEDAKFWASEQRSQKLFDALPKISVQGYNRDRQVIYWNKASEKIYGYTAYEAIGQNLENLIIPPAMRQDVVNLIEVWVNGGEPIPACELTLMAKDRSSVYVYSSHVLLNNSRNEPELYCIDIDLSEHRQTESALKQSEAQSRAILEAIPDLMFRVGTDGLYRGFITSNRDFGILPSDADPTGQSMAELMPEAISNQQFYYMQQALLTGELQVYEQQIQIGDRLQDEEVRVFKSGDDEVLFMIRNISDRKQAEAALKQSEFQNRAVLAAIPDLLFRMGSDGLYRGIITDYRDFNLLSPTSDPTGRSMIDVLPTEVAERHFYYMQQALQTEELQIYEQQIQVGDRLQDEEVRVIKIDDDEVLFMIRNISDRKQAEAALKQSEMTNRTIIETLPDLLIQMDIEGRYISMFAGSGVRVVCPPTSLDQPEIYNVLPADLAEQRLYYAKQAIETGSLQIYEQIFNFEDEKRYEEVRIAPLNDREVLIIIRDITDAKQIEFERLQNEELTRATRLKDEFLATMSHELRTPLNAILGMSEVLIEQIFGDINERQLKALQTIQNGGSHLLELINDILDVAKIESGQVELDCHPTAIVPLCQSSLAFIRQQAIAKHIQIKTHWQNNLPDVLVDERRIRQVLINLLNNAVKFTTDGGQITLEVNLTSQEDPLLGTRKHLQIAIADTGIGISPENIPKLFQPFIQIDSALNRKYQGTGLGLALVKRIVELHGGTVGLISEVGVGSCFTIVIPCTDVVTTSPKRETQIDLRHEPSQAKHDNYFSILLAEDNETNIEMLSPYLEANGYHLLFAKNGLEAIAIAKSHQPDLILMDIQMPIMDGLEATKQIRLDPNLVNTPIIALTALAMTGDREKCLDAGASEYLTKPVQLKALAQMIQTFLAH